MSLAWSLVNDTWLVVVNIVVNTVVNIVVKIVVNSDASWLMMDFKPLVSSQKPWSRIGNRYMGQGGYQGEPGPTKLCSGFRTN